MKYYGNFAEYFAPKNARFKVQLGGPGERSAGQRGQEESKATELQAGSKAGVEDKIE